MSIYLCTRGHRFRSQIAADNCRWCRNAGRPKRSPEIKFDAAGRRLICAAHIVQAQQNFTYEEKDAGGNMHPIRALYIASHERKGPAFNTAVRRLFDCCGIDFMDHSQVENIDDLVAAAFWEIESDHAERRAA